MMNFNTLKLILITIITINAFSFLTHHVQGQIQPPPLLTVAQILQKHIEAIGGSNSLNSIFSRKLSGEVSGDLFPRPSKFEQLAKAPNKLLTIIEHPHLGIIITGCDGSSVWMKSRKGIVSITGELAELTLQNAIFHRELKLIEIYPDLNLVTITNINGITSYLLQSHATPTTIKRFYIDSSSYLLMREESEISTPHGILRVQADAYDYRKIDQIMVPLKIVRKEEEPTRGTSILQFIIGTVQHNIEIPDSKFIKPNE